MKMLAEKMTLNKALKIRLVKQMILLLTTCKIRVKVQVQIRLTLLGQMSPLASLQRLPNQQKLLKLLSLMSQRDLPR